jgi:AcrR family transcriptional regulator
MSAEASDPLPQPIWARPEPGARNPRFTRDQIARTAIEIADTEGFDAVSMRRVAAALGAGTMTLYHYVRTKDELLQLMDDAIMAEVLVPDEALRGDWRDALTAIARGSRNAFDHHPWAFDALRGVYGGPNSIRHFEQSLAAVAGTGLDLRGRLELLALVDDYVFGSLVRGQAMEDGHLELDDEAWWAVVGHLHQRIVEGDYPQMQALVGDGDPVAAWKRVISVMHEDRFERGLAILLDGIEAHVRRRTAAGS